MSPLAKLAGRQIHLVGVSSLEIADVACFLGARGLGRLVGHDLADTEALEEHFRAAHIGMPAPDRQAHWQALQALDLPLRLADDYLSEIDAADVIIVSQAWRLYEQNAPLARLAASGRVRLLTPIEVYLALAAERGVATIGVTGSNGKSTTANMVAHVLGSVGVPIVLAGNYRFRGPILESLDGLSAEGRLVLEVSNHHLLALDSPIDVAVVTNVTPNHLEEHGSFEAYVAAKRRIAECQRESGLLILNADDPVSRQFAGVARGTVRHFGLTDDRTEAGVSGGCLVLREEGESVELLPADQLPMPGAHNLQNALAAALAVRSVGATPAEIGEALATFRGPPGRLERIRTASGVELVYDIESTTPESTRRGLEAFAVGRVHLVAGGDDKGLDYQGFADAVLERRAHLYLLEGTASAAIREAADERGLDYEDHDTLEAAVRAAWCRAQAGDVILLSPGARGFYNRHIRGRVSFARIAKRLRRSELGSQRSGNE